MRSFSAFKTVRWSGLCLVSIALAAGLGLVRQTTFRPALIWEKSLAPGLVYRMEYDPNLPRTIHAVRITPGAPGISFRPELAGGTVNEPGGVNGRWTPTDMARQTGALVAVNGDFFGFAYGSPVGEMVRSGELVVTPVRPRMTFVWGPKDATVAPANAQAWVSFGEDPEMRLDAINQPISAQGLVLYTPAEGEAQPPSGNVAAILRAPEGSFSPSTTSALTVESIVSDQVRTVVPTGHAFLIGTGDRATKVATLRAGDVVRLRTAAPGIDWERYENAIGGGPNLVRGGELAVDAADEGFNADFQARHPRSAVGVTAHGDVWIVTVDGGQAASVGASLVELAKVMRRLGCTDAINLDGGGSTALNVLGLTVNRPVDAAERPVANGIVVLGPRPAEVAGQMKVRVAAQPTPEGLYVATVYRNGVLVPNCDVLWSARGAAWIDEGGDLHPVHHGRVTVSARALGQAVEAEVTVPGPTVDPSRLAPADR